MTARRALYALAALALLMGASAMTNHVQADPVVLDLDGSDFADALEHSRSLAAASAASVEDDVLGAGPEGFLSAGLRRLFGAKQVADEEPVAAPPLDETEVLDAGTVEADDPSAHPEGAEPAPDGYDGTAAPELYPEDQAGAEPEVIDTAGYDAGAHDDANGDGADGLALESAAGDGEGFEMLDAAGYPVEAHSAADDGAVYASHSEHEEGADGADDLGEDVQGPARPPHLRRQDAQPEPAAPQQQQQQPPQQQQQQQAQPEPAAKPAVKPAEPALDLESAPVDMPVIEEEPVVPSSSAAAASGKRGASSKLGAAPFKLSVPLIIAMAVAGVIGVCLATVGIIMLRARSAAAASAKAAPAAGKAGKRGASAAGAAPARRSVGGVDLEARGSRGGAWRMSWGGGAKN